MRRLVRGGFACLVALLLMVTPAWSNDTEQRLMAVYLGRFAEYVLFPPERQQQSEFVITVLGSDPFGGQLQALYQSRQIHKKTVRIVHAAHIQNVPPSDLLYVNLPTQAGRDAAI